MRVARWGLAVAAVLWTAAIFAAPVALFPVGAFICHQRPERSFFVHGHQLPVCARCTGLYVGAAVAGPLAAVLAAPFAAVRSRRLFVVAALPTLVTWTLEFSGLMPFSSLARCVAALPLGFAAAWLVLAEIRGATPKAASNAASRTSALGPRTS